MERGGIKSVKSLLERYANTLRAPQGSVIAVFREVVQEELGVGIKKEFVQYKTGTRTVCITVAGPQKSEILLRKERILDRCGELLGQKNAPKHII